MMYPGAPVPGKMDKFRSIMNRKNILLIIAVLVVAVLLLCVARFTRPTAEESQVVITVAGKEYARVPLSQPGQVTITQEDGSVNVVEITGKGAVMAYSTCGNQLCVDMGEVTVDNWEWRPNQQFIICLPNQVSVELVVSQEP